MNKMTAFNTIQYCIDNSIPCFTFAMDDTKKLGKNNQWKHITKDNFKDHINPKHNGVALVTGHTHFMLDIDFKHNIPESITHLLKAHLKRLLVFTNPIRNYFVIN